MHARTKEVMEIGDRLFSQRGSMLSLWQEIAMNFYPERADFLGTTQLGEEFAAHLMTGVPVLARRELAAQFQGMLRPRGKQWFSLVPEDERLEQNIEIRRWSEYATALQRRAMYDVRSKFVRTTTEGDNDFATFGQAVITAELNLAENRLLYRSWHLRDVAWMENDSGDIDVIHRKWNVTLRDMVRRWPDKVSSSVRDLVTKDPFKEIACRHIVLPCEHYEAESSKKPKGAKFVSITVDRENETVLKEEYLQYNPYIIPRWQTVSGSQYAHSPATVIALSDARLLQRITWTLLQAGEKATNPPMLAVQEAIRSDVSIYAGGITWVDAAYDERLGEVLRPISMDPRGLNFGVEMMQRHEKMIKEAFFLNKIGLPPAGGEMTATEVQLRTQEYIRAALPLFEPMETEYSSPLCEITFQILLGANAFGPPESWPKEARGLEMKWQFDSPLTSASKRQDTVTFQESAQLLALAASIDPSVAAMVDIKSAFKDALFGIGAKGAWMRSDADSKAITDKKEEAGKIQQMLDMAGQGAGVAEQVGKAAQVLGGGQPAV